MLGLSDHSSSGILKGSINLLLDWKSRDTFCSYLASIVGNFANQNGGQRWPRLLPYVILMSSYVSNSHSGWSIIIINK